MVRKAVKYLLKNELMDDREGQWWLWLRGELTAGKAGYMIIVRFIGYQSSKKEKGQRRVQKGCGLKFGNASGGKKTFGGPGDGPVKCVL